MTFGAGFITILILFTSTLAFSFITGTRSCAPPLSMKAAIPFLPTAGVTQLGEKISVAASHQTSFTLTARSPLKSSMFSSKQSFTVQFTRKDRKTAIGFASFQPPQGTYTYLTPDSFDQSPSGQLYVTMGGAGFIYPSKKRASKGYGNGDTIQIEIDFSSNLVQFRVNDDVVGTVPWLKGSSEAYPVISCEGGAIDMIITT